MSTYPTNKCPNTPVLTFSPSGTALCQGKAISLTYSLKLFLYYGVLRVRSVCCLDRPTTQCWCLADVALCLVLSKAEKGTGEPAVRGKRRLKRYQNDRLWHKINAFQHFIKEATVMQMLTLRLSDLEASWIIRYGKMWALFERQTNQDGCKLQQDLFLFFLECMIRPSLVGILRGSNLRKVSIAKIMY